jgi:hypothetical protein
MRVLLPGAAGAVDGLSVSAGVEWARGRHAGGVIRACRVEPLWDPAPRWSGHFRALVLVSTWWG